MTNRYRLSGFLAASYFLFSTSWADPVSFLQLQQDIPLTGGISRFDYQTLDPQTHTLYLAHMGAGQIVAFNTQTERIYTLTGYPGVTGLLVLPDRHRLYASVTGRHQVAVIDTQNLKALAWIPAGRFPDGMAYVPDEKKLFVSDEMGGEVTVIDVEKNKRIASIKIGGQVGNVRFDPVDKVLYVPAQAKNELMTMDPKTLKITRQIPLQGGVGPHGLWIDPSSRMAFVACAKNSKLVAFDLKSLKEIGVSPLGKEPDVMDFDNQLGYLYVASESGIVSVFRVRDRKVEKVGDFPVGENAHSVSVDSQTHFVYFPLRQVNQSPVLRIMKPAN